MAYVKTSYGIALCRIKNNAPEIIMVKKRLSYGFCAFVIGKYRKGNISDITNLLNDMTLQEKMDIMSLDFQFLWAKVWNTDFVCKNTRPSQQTATDLEFNDNIKNKRERLSAREMSASTQLPFSSKQTIVPLASGVHRGAWYTQSTPHAPLGVCEAASNTMSMPAASQHELTSVQHARQCGIKSNQFQIKAQRETKTINNIDCQTRGITQSVWNSSKYAAKENELHRSDTFTYVQKNTDDENKRKKIDVMRFHNSYIKGKNKFEYIISDGGKQLKNMINRSTNASVIWEIPKGKQIPDETELDSAIREFFEETGISPEYYDILWDEPPLVEYFTDLGNTYCNKYFIAKTKHHKFWSPKIYFAIKKRFDEIEFAKWISMTELTYLHISENAKKRLIKFIKLVFRKLKKYC